MKSPSTIRKSLQLVTTPSEAQRTKVYICTGEMAMYARTYRSLVVLAAILLAS